MTRSPLVHEALVLSLLIFEGRLVCMAYLVEHNLCLDKALLGMPLLGYISCLNLLSKSSSTISSQCDISIKPVTLFMHMK